MNAQLNQQLSNDFKREHRYYVLKLSDLQGTVSFADLLYLDEIARKVADRRAQEGKEQREYLVIESDWPEFEPTWQAIEARVSGVPQQVPQLEVAGWRPKFPERPTSLPPSSFNAGMPDQTTVDYWKAQGVEIEYCYTGPAPSVQEGFALVPMTEDELNEMALQLGREMKGLRCWGWMDLVRAVERHHTKKLAAAQAKGGAA